MTYGLDGEGRLSTAVHGTTNIVCDASCTSASTTYYPSGEVHTINVGGTGDNDNYTYDAVGRMQSYTYTVGSTPTTMNGQLTWNQNGTLQKLAITDGFNSAGTQDCTYGYDDWARMSSVNCMDSSNTTNVWGQNFLIDAYGNITKSVPTNATGISWTPGYNANNRYTLGGASYDAAGNLLNDTFHTYTWDVYGKLSTIDSSACGTNGTCLTYDALGRTVEKNVSGTIKQVLYSPVGKTAIMTGQTTDSSYVPLPGGQMEAEGSTFGGETTRY